ncbi:hypothetical protein EBS02_10465 [bacterium]|nr:hypothetical protein [bacterium]
MQTFPDDYIFYGSVTSQYRQIGNAVPVLLAYTMGVSILDYLQKMMIAADVDLLNLSQKYNGENLSKTLTKYHSRKRKETEAMSRRGKLV